MHFKELILALLEGFGLILSPCILPVLPIMLATSLDGGKKRPFGIITGFILAFTIFAIFSRQVLLWLNIDPETIRNVSLGLLILVGVIMLLPKLSEFLLQKAEGVARLGDRMTAKFNAGNGYFSGLMIGMLIGLIWTPCAGPIMAAAVIQIVQAKTGDVAILTVLMFVTGAAVPMFIIALFGRRIMKKASFFKNHAQALRQGLGAVIIIMGVLIWSGADVSLLAGSAPSSMTVAADDAVPANDGGIVDGIAKPYPAKEFLGIQEWINSAPLTMKSLKGKVVLVDFWTYSCINCVRTLPYIKAWNEKYADKGLVIVGVHAPEFAFEKKPDNVKSAVTKNGIKYPVALDNDLATWAAFNNEYWPAHYLIDKEGNVVYTHFGEGHYAITENNIRVLLGLKPETAIDDHAAKKSALPQSPETYLGYGRAAHFSGTVTKNAEADYSYPATLDANGWALSGKWKIDEDSITAAADSGLRYHFQAGHVYIVLGTADDKPVDADVLLDGKPIADKGGKDVKDSVLTVDRETLYEVAALPSAESHTLEIRPKRAGLMGYSFTFGP